MWGERLPPPKPPPGTPVPPQGDDGVARQARTPIEACGSGAAWRPCSGAPVVGGQRPGAPSPCVPSERRRHNEGGVAPAVCTERGGSTAPADFAAAQGAPPPTPPPPAPRRILPFPNLRRKICPSGTAAPTTTAAAAAVAAAATATTACCQLEGGDGWAAGTHAPPVPTTARQAGRGGAGGQAERACRAAAAIAPVAPALGVRAGGGGGGGGEREAGLVAD